jgi:hypothetical protein
MERAGNYQACDELSQATLGLSLSSPRASKIKLFKPDNTKIQASAFTRQKQAIFTVTLLKRKSDIN